MPDGVEIKGSRRVWQDGRFTYGENLWIATTYNDSNVPVRGTMFTPPTGSIETQPNGRAAVDIVTDPEAIPGIFLTKVVFRGFLTFS